MNDATHTAPNYAAGKVVNLTADVTITIGKIVDVDLHPSGKAFDGAAVVVAAYRTSLGHNMVSLVSLADATHRVVARHAEPFAD